jgi:hypothetical protein
MVTDYERNVNEGDATHIPEIIELHDLKRDPGVADQAEFIARCQANAENRCVHHHVFNTRSAASLLTKAGFTVERIEPVLPFHIVLLAQKRSLNARRGADVDWACRRSPFQSDRI